MKGRLTYYSSTGALAILFLFPLLWSSYSSVRTSHGFGLDNYVNMVRYGEGIEHYLINTIVVSALTVAGTLLVSVLGGYAFGRFTFPGKNLLFLVTLAILTVPYPTILIPLYVLLGWLHLQNSLVGLALVLVMFQLPFGIYLMRNSFEAVPRELEEAALVDGAGAFTAMLRVSLPIVLPGVVTVALFAFLTSWNEYLAPLIFLNDGSKYTLPVMLVNIRYASYNIIDFGALQAGVVVAMVPCLLVYLALQRFYVSGLVTGALRG